MNKSELVYVDFRPIAEPGWRVLEVSLLDDPDDPEAEPELYVKKFPLAGWVIRRCTCREDELIPDGHECNERSIHPAYWCDDHCLDLADASGMISSSSVHYVLGPGQQKPSEDEMRERVTDHQRLRAVRA